MTKLNTVNTLSKEYSLNRSYTRTSFHFNPHLDVGYLEEYYQQDISDAAFMFEVFLNCTVQKFYDFIASSVSNNYSKAFYLAHQMIPTFKLVGLTGIAFQLKELENKVRQSLPLQALVKSINTNFKKAIPIVFTQKAKIDSFLKMQKN